MVASVETGGRGCGHGDESRRVAWTRLASGLAGRHVDTGAGGALFHTAHVAELGVCFRRGCLNHTAPQRRLTLPTICPHSTKSRVCAVPHPQAKHPASLRCPGCRR
eukprot:166311-Chlamydomonas_euryale.AAC.2